MVNTCKYIYILAGGSQTIFMGTGVFIIMLIREWIIAKWTWWFTQGNEFDYQQYNQDLLDWDLTDVFHNLQVYQRYTQENSI